MAAWAELHFNIARQWTRIVSGTQTVLQTAKKSCGECFPEVPGVHRQAKSPDFKEKVTICNFFAKKWYKQFERKKRKCLLFNWKIHTFSSENTYIVTFSYEKDTKHYFFIRKYIFYLLFTYKNDANFSLHTSFFIQKVTNLYFLVRNRCDSLLFYKKSLQIITFLYEQDINLHFLIR